MPFQTDFTRPLLVATDEEERFAARILAAQLQLRSGILPEIAPSRTQSLPEIVLCRNVSARDKDAYTLRQEGACFTISAQNRRGLLYGVGRFLRKLELRDGKIVLAADLSGDYAPRKRIRGHQLGYRGNNNTYDAWTPEDFRRYSLEMMFFGANICEHVPDEHNNRSPLMKLPPNEMLLHACALAQDLDLDLGLWYPIRSCDDAAEAAEERRRVFESLSRLDMVFIPGADPGDLPPGALFARAQAYRRLLKERHPEATLWVSAQMPHNAPEWPQEFAAALAKLPEELDGVIIGPNHAFGVEELRRLAPSRYDYRLYPDITHNLRCEYPVHYDREDWHFALASTLSRESVNPRPQEFRALHRQTRGFLSGSVSYSEGVHDDVNKMLWSDLDYFGEAMPLRESLCDYARLFFFGLPPEKIADALLQMEQNWAGDPAENAGIDACLAVWEDLLERFPAQLENWRFGLHLFRARCDAFVRGKRLHELSLLSRARALLLKNAPDQAQKILQTPPPEKITALRAGLFPLAQRLYDQIGIQLDVEHFGGESWERGATLDTIDRPVSDLPWLLGRLEKARALPPAEGQALLRRSLARNQTAPDEFYYSFALHGWEALGCKQEGEFYLNFQGDRPCNDGRLPTCLFQVYDHFSLKCRLGGFTPGQDYCLRVTYYKEGNSDSKDFVITANGYEIYHGAPYGGKEDPLFDAEQLAENYHSASYLLPAAVFENGCLALEFSEALSGLMLSEFWVRRVSGYGA
ncbi:MAG: hypothetical protein LBQ33_05955 [Oscillospiraceae bacterium]|nr:hypothetical protein [Oscillospiraceae bacterium]